MAILLDDTSSGRDETAASTITVSHICTGQNLILVAFVASRDNPNDGADPTGVTWNTTESMTLVSNTSDAGQISGNWWYLINPSTGTHDIVATWSSDKDQRLLISHSYTGALQTGQPNASGGRQNGNDDATADKTVDVTTTVANCMIVGAVGRIFNSIPTVSPHAAQVTLDGGASLQGFSADGIQVAVGTNTMTWNSGWQFDSDVMRNIAIAPIPDSPSFATNNLRPRVFAPGISR